jgi:hypothetical protein
MLAEGTPSLNPAFGMFSLLIVFVGLFWLLLDFNLLVVRNGRVQWWCIIFEIWIFNVEYKILAEGTPSLNPAFF